MDLSSGKRVGPYEIVDLLGAGGMGVVYKAHDPRLGRQVAVKVLLPDVLADTLALARFEREVRAIAALSHPNILSIFDFQRDGETVYAAMELLTGGTLRDRLRQGPLPPRKAIDVGVQIAQGLAAAHEKSFVHRDLKPENIAFAQDGRVKILDFGLAREFLSRVEAQAESPTRLQHTTPGLILGTVGYMSPEQVRGLEVDHRSDIFAFGAVLYEMLTGRRAFDGATPADTMSAILNQDAGSIHDSGVRIPPALDRVVRRCLEKRADERFHSARDLAFALENATTTGPQIERDAAAARRRVTWSRVLPPVGFAAAGLAAGVLLTLALRAPATIDPPRVRQLTLSGLDSAPSASPDGRLVAFASSQGDGTSRIWTKDLTTGGEQRLTDGPDRLPRFTGDGTALFFLRHDGGVDTIFQQSTRGTVARDVLARVIEAEPSPDGQRLAFVRFELTGTPDAGGSGTLAATIGVADLTGTNVTEATLLQETGVEFTSLRWSPDGRRVAAVRRATASPSPTAIVIVDAVARRVEAEWAPEPELGSYGTLAWSGDGRQLIVTQQLGGGQVFVPGALGRIALVDAGTGRSRALLYRANLFGLFGSPGSNARIDVAGPGRLLIEDVAMRHNLEEVPLVPGAASRGAIGGTGNSLDRQPTYSHDGSAVVFSSNRSNNLDLWLATTDGRLFQLTDDAASDWDPAFSADGRDLLWSSDREGHFEIWTARLEWSDRPTLVGRRRVSNDGDNAQNPTMTPDGWVVYRSTRSVDPGIWRVRFDGRDAALLYAGKQLSVPDVSPDGRYALFIDRDRPKQRATIRVVEIATARVESFTIAVDYLIDEWNADIRWGRARWKPDSSAVLFVGQDRDGSPAIFSQAFVPGRDTSATRQRLVPSAPGKLVESFDISPDGQRLTISIGTYTRTVMIAEGVAGVDRAGRAGR